MIVLSLIVLFITFVTSFFVTKKWIQIAHQFGLVGKDMNKFRKPEVAESGGVSVIIAISIGLLLYVALKTFVLGSETHVMETLALLVTFLLSGFLGFVDDILGWKKGLKQWQKPLFTIPAALPLAVISAGVSTMCVPLIGCIDLGVLYPLVIVPAVIIIAANGFNMLAGYNGLEAGQGTIILSFLCLIFYLTNQYWLSFIALIGIAALLAFLKFNWYPAKVFPGDSLTYSIGAFIGALAVLGNAEKAFAILFIPYVLDFILKARSKFKAETFAKANPDNSLELLYEKLYSTMHVVLWLLKKIKRKVYERDVMACMFAVQILCGLISLLVYVWM